MSTAEKTHQDVASTLWMEGTPFFFIDGKTAIFDADIPKIENLLRKRQ